MGKLRAFIETPRIEAGNRPVHDRIKDFSEIEQTLNTKQRREQAARCMDCGVPFCHWACPLGNKNPEWNDALCNGDLEEAYRLLSDTNDFPEFTGRVCPAACEKACVLNLTLHEPTTNRENEAAITEVAWADGFIVPRTYARNGLSAAVIGAGPSGLVAANRLNRRGYEVTVFDKNEAAGGLLRYGIPNFKLNKTIIDRRVKLLEQEGVHFVHNTAVDLDALATKGEIVGNCLLEKSKNGEKCLLEKSNFDIYIVATGTPQPRDLNIPGRELKGVYFALELLSQQNRILAGMEFGKDELVSAKGRNVLVIGGGDTGSDCIGTAHRQGCLSVTQIEIMPRPVEGSDDPANPWPNFPRTLKTTSSHEEGCVRRWNINTLEFIGENGRLTGVR
ncbi:MAG: glutamate synthase subunit beta, partial [Bacteroidales bacterium]|nr:glutamate synthase subunit beta [Bacteroidales bacterium]